MTKFYIPTPPPPQVVKIIPNKWTRISRNQSWTMVATLSPRLIDSRGRLLKEEFFSAKSLSKMSVDRINFLLKKFYKWQGLNGVKNIDLSDDDLFKMILKDKKRALMKIPVKDVEWLTGVKISNILRPCLPSFMLQLKHKSKRIVKRIVDEDQYNKIQNTDDISVLSARQTENGIEIVLSEDDFLTVLFKYF